MTKDEPAAVTADERRLYGLSGAERLYFDVAVLYECEVDSQFEELPESVEIEEWSVHPPSYHLPSAEHVLYWLDEWVCDNGETGEDMSLEEVVKLPEVVKATEVWLSAVAAQITWRMADTHLRNHVLTFDGDEPLLDGAPIYRTTPSDR